MSNKEYNIIHTQMGGGELKEDVGGGSSALAPATADTLGVVKIGNGISVTEDGTISAQGGGVVKYPNTVFLSEVMSFTSAEFNIGAIDISNPPVLFTALGLYLIPQYITLMDETYIIYSGGIDTAEMYNKRFTITVAQDESPLTNVIVNSTDDITLYLNVEDAVGYVPVTASTDNLGLVKIGDGINVDENGVISADTERYYALITTIPSITWSESNNIQNGSAEINLNNSTNLVQCVKYSKDASGKISWDFSNVKPLSEVYDKVDYFVFKPIYKDSSMQYTSSYNEVCVPFYKALSGNVMKTNSEYFYADNSNGNKIFINTIITYNQTDNSLHYNIVGFKLTN